MMRPLFFLIHFRCSFFKGAFLFDFGTLLNCITIPLGAVRGIVNLKTKVFTCGVVWCGV